MAFHLRILAVLCLLAGSSQADDLTPEQLSFFETKIRPVLIRECYGCHSNQSGNVRGGLRLDTKELMAIGGATGPAIVPGNLEESWLYNAITHQDYVMPPKRKLSQNIIDDFKTWIEMGAPDPRTNDVGEIRSSISEDDIQKAKDTFWAYKPPVVKKAPQVENTSWAKNEIDQFVQAKLEDNDIPLPRDAEPYQVMRRITFDLVGLPPTPEQITAFTRRWKQNPDEAVSQLVDLLLEKDQFGERWGRHWMDVVRYAESTGREVNMTYPEAWRYRDYIIDSFNDDKPFDRFLQEQIAGDLLPVRTDEEWAENLVATTFLAVGPKNVNEQNRVQFAMDVIDEQIDATTRVFLGTSVACARCHDHKFDAIPQTDYYALAGVFSNMTTYFGNIQSDLGSFSGAQTKQNSTLLHLPIKDPNPFDPRLTKSQIEDLRNKITETRREMVSLRGNRSNPNSQRDRLRMLRELQELSGQLGEVDANGQPYTYTMGVQEDGSPRDARVLVRGEIGQPGQSVDRGFPQVLCSAPNDIKPSSSGRLELARWMSSKDNPLTARVMVNRIWKHMVGQGIVTSTENFGVTGQPPSHPELLDYLAIRFMESDWSVKDIIREIATSRVYRISSEFNESNHNKDPDNALIWRSSPRRLDAEAIRDAMLAISGEIDYDRPRASLVAEAGYTRVQGGVLGDPRAMGRAMGEKMRDELIRKARENGQAGGNMRPGQNSGRPGFNGRGSNGPGAGSQRGRASNRGSQAQGRGPNSGRRMSGGPGRGNMNQRPGTNAPSMGGQSMRGMASRDEIIAEVARRVASQLDMEDAKFRSVYLPVVRDEEPRSLEVFDFADSSSIIGQRESSNTPNQALYMMNNPFVLQQSEALAKRLQDSGSSIEEQVEYAFLLTYGRKPTSRELKAMTSFARSFSASSGRDRPSTRDTLAAVCQSLFASAEFRYLD